MKRKAVLAAVLGAAAVAAAVPMVVSGTANAQAGSRVCGRHWSSATSGEEVVKIYEVQKHDVFTCTTAMSEQYLGESPYASVLRDQNFNGYTSTVFELMVCEDWKIPGKTIVYPDRTPLADQNDICNNMERSDNLGDMERYWLYFNGDPMNSLVEFNRN